MNIKTWVGMWRWQWLAVAAVAVWLAAVLPDGAAAQLRFGVEGGGFSIGGGNGQRGMRSPRLRSGKHGKPNGKSVGKGRGDGVSSGIYEGSEGKKPGRGKHHRGQRRPGITVVVPGFTPGFVAEDEPDEPTRPRRPKSRSDGGSPRPPQVGVPLRRPPGTPPAPIGPVAGELRDRELLVTFADGTPDSVVSALGRAYRLTRQSSFRSDTLGVRLVRFRIPDRRDLAQVLGQVAGDVRVLAVQPVYVYVSSQGVGGMAGPPQYAAEKLHLAEAHRMARGQNVTIAIIDTSVDVAHPELKGATVRTFDAVGGSATGPQAHGTAIAGIVAARRQLQGTAPDARIVAVRSFTQASSGRFEGTSETLIKGIDMGLANGSRVFNLSFTGPKDPSLEQIILAAERKGAIFVAAAGNGGPSAPAAYPAAYETVIAVTAVDSNDQVYKQANRGSYIALAAPGVDILAPAPRQGYRLQSGTSLAAAHVTGIAALLIEINPDLKATEIRKLLSDSARPGASEGEAAHVGAGIVDAAKALSEVRSTTALR